jgi:hypothetical protein
MDSRGSAFVPVYRRCSVGFYKNLAFGKRPTGMEKVVEQRRVNE